MAELRELSDEEFHATFILPMMEVPPERQVSCEGEEKYVELWLEIVAPKYRITDIDLEHVYENGIATYQQALFATNFKNMYLVLVYNIESRAIEGHHLLYLNEKYGLPSPLAKRPDID